MTARHAVLFPSLVFLCLAAAEAETEKGYCIIYERGLYRGRPEAVMKRQERWARESLAGDSYAMD